MVTYRVTLFFKYDVIMSAFLMLFLNIVFAILFTVLFRIIMFRSVIDQILAFLFHIIFKQTFFLKISYNTV